MINAVICVKLFPIKCLDAALQLLKAISWKQDYPGSFEMESKCVPVLIHCYSEVIGEGE